MGDRAGLIVDYGGVLTTDVFASFRAFCEAEGLEPETVRERFMGDPQARALLGGLETGELTEAQFEPRFAALLEVSSERLIDRLFGGMEPDAAMIDGVRAARGAGVRTGMLSNSWGRDRYDVAALEELFDAWVISGEVGLRKPEPEIFGLTCERLELAPAECVFVDDMPDNVEGARACGLAAIHHTSYDETAAELERLFGRPLA